MQGSTLSEIFGPVTLAALQQGFQGYFGFETEPVPRIYFGPFRVSYDAPYLLVESRFRNEYKEVTRFTNTATVNEEVASRFKIVVSQSSSTKNDYDTFTEQGMYNLFSSAASTNAPETGRSTLMVTKVGTYTHQLSLGDDIKYRVKQAGASSAWSDWKTLTAT